MIKCISYWAFPGGLEGTKDPVEAMREAKKAGYDGIELCIGAKGHLTHKTSDEKCKVLLKEAKKIDIRIASCASGIYWDYPLTHKKASIREKGIEITKGMIRVSRQLGSNALLFIPGAVDVFFLDNYPVVPADVADKLARKAVRALLPTAAKYKVCLAVENVWNKMLLSPLEMRDFIRSFKSPYVGAYVDVANMMPFGYPEQWISILGKKVKRIHFKDFKTSVGTADGFCDLLKGDVNFPAVMKALKKIGYKGPVTAEVFPTQGPRIVQSTSRAMDRILGRKNG